MVAVVGVGYAQRLGAVGVRIRREDVALMKAAVAQEFTDSCIIIHGIRSRLG
jgi:hypothetical protein